MLSHSFTFVHPADEEAFLLSYSKAGVFIDVAAASVGLVAVLLKAIGRSILLKQPTAADDTAAPPTSNWYIEITRFTLCIWTILAFAVLGRRRYTLIRGPASVIHRVVYALGLPLTVRPGLCRYCELLWHQRLLIINSMCVVTRVPLSSYWLGGVLSFGLAVAVDTADPDYSCKQSASCTFGSLLQLANIGITQPRVLFESVLQPLVLSHAAMYLAGVIVPGVLLRFMEIRARKAWLRCHRRQQQQQQQLQRQQHMVAYPAGTDPQQLKPSTTSALSLEQQQQQPEGEQHSQPAAAHHDAEVSGPTSSSRCSAASGTIADTLYHPTAAHAHPLLYHSPNMTYLFAVSHSNITDVPDAISASSSTGVPAASATTLRLDAVAAAVAAAAAAAPAGPSGGGPMLYRSPVEAHMYSFKFRPPPGASSQSLEQFRRQLQQRLEAELQAHPTATAAAAAAGTNLPPRPIVTQCAAFPGCYQLVFQILVPKVSEVALAVTTTTSTAATAAPGSAQVSGSSDSSSKQVQPPDLQPSVWQFVRSKQDWQLLSAQSGLQHAAPSAEMSATGPFLQDAADDAANAFIPLPSTVPDGKLSMPAVALQPHVLPWVASSGCATSQSGYSSDSSSSKNSSGSEVYPPNQAVDLLLHPGLVQDLLHQGHQHVRVVISKQPSGIVLLDEQCQLQEPNVHTSLASGQQTAAEHHQCYQRVCLELAVASDAVASDAEFSSSMQHQVLSVVVLADTKAPWKEATAHTVCSTTSSAGSVEADATAAAREVAAVQDAAGGAAAGCGVLAQLPIVMLPASAHQEFEQLVHSICNNFGVSAVQAQQLTVPLVSDLASVLSKLAAVSRGHSQGSNKDSSKSSMYTPGHAESVIDLTVDGLLAYFGQCRMFECRKLLQSVVQQRGLVSAVADPLKAVAATGDKGDANEPSSASGASAEAPASASYATCSAMPGSNGGARGPKAGEQLGSHVAGGTTTRGASTQTTTKHSMAVTRYCQPAFNTPAELEQMMLSPNACSINWKTTLLGFSDTSVEKVYASYKSICMRKWDFLVMLWYLFGFCSSTLKHAVLVVRGADVQQLLVSQLRVLMVFISVVPPAVLWAASYPGRLHMLIRWRGTVHVAAVLVMLAICGAYFCLGGAYQAAITSLGDTYNTSPSIVLSYNAAVQPFILRTEVPATVTYICCHLFGLNMVFGRRGLGPLSAKAAHHFLTALNLALTVFLEFKLRQSFAARAQQPAGPH